MRNRLAVGHFSRRPLGIDVDPLIVASGLGKLVDPILVDDHPFGQANLDAFQRFGLLNGTDNAQLLFLFGPPAR